ncbi:MAG: 30S ribosomal protein S1 [Nitrospirae bacterium]|nr:30S ribosomal protein S1 [Nitrospirota bacterium]
MEIMYNIGTMELQREDIEKLYADTFKGLQEGKIYKGRIIQIGQDGVVVDIGYKSEGLIPRGEFSPEELESLGYGKEMDVYVVSRTITDGFIRISKDRATKIRTWDVLEEAVNNNTTVQGKITGKVKGGMTVDISGVKAFLPASHVDIKMLKDTDHLIGQSFTFRIIKLDTKRSNVIVSRRALLEEEREKLRKETLVSLNEGDIVKGAVKNITDYGVFVDIGGVDGLIHISDMSWGRISHPSELFSIADTVEAVVLKFDRETDKVTLGYKQKKSDPWAQVEEKYPPNKQVMGKVISIADYGIFVELEEGIEGLVHVTELDWSRDIKKPSKYFSIGDTVEAVVIKVLSNERKISLSIKQLKPNPWELIAEKYSSGQKVRGRVRNLADFGAFINIDDGIDALLHISDMSWTKHIKHPSEVLKKGQEVEVVILNIEPEKERMSVGLKELLPDPWVEEIPVKYASGNTVKGRITRVGDSSLLLELEDGVEGFISLHGKQGGDESLYNIGAEVTAKVIKADTKKRRIDLEIAEA